MFSVFYLRVFEWKLWIHVFIELQTVGGYREKERYRDIRETDIVDSMFIL